MKTLHTVVMALAMSAISLKGMAQKENLAEDNVPAEGTEVIALKWGAVYPAPVISSFTCSVNSSAEAGAVLRLIDLSGRTALERPVVLAQGDNRFEVSMADMAPGMYQLVLQTDTKRLTFKLLKSQ